MRVSDLNASAQKTVAAYEKRGLRRAAKAENHSKRATQFYLDLTNLWKTKNQEQTKQYKAIRDSDLFGDERALTFLRYNYRSCEKGTYNYPTAFKILGSKSSSKLKLKGTMQVADLLSDASMHEVMGSPTFPRDRLKILKVWARNGLA